LRQHHDRGHSDREDRTSGHDLLAELRHLFAIHDRSHQQGDAERHRTRHDQVRTPCGAKASELHRK
jgi:hypothetical protein